MHAQFSLEESIINAVDNYVGWSTEIDPNDGVYINSELEVSIVSIKECPEIDFYPITSLIRYDNGKAEADFELCAEVAQRYVFVR